jgi:hypothetical protein
MRVAIVSDIHGNRALEAVLADLRRTKEEERFLSAQADPFTGVKGKEKTGRFGRADNGFEVNLLCRT